MRRRSKILIGVGAVVVLAVVGGILYLLLGEGDGPAELSFDDATTTTARASGGSGGSSTTSAVPVAVDGSWVATDGSRAGYRVLEDRLGGAANLEAVGRTDRVTGGFTVSGTTVSDVTFTVDVASISSDSGLRDGQFRGRIMEADRFPTATFAADPIQLDAVPPPDGSTVEVPVTGRLTLRGVTRDVSSTVQVRHTADQVQVLGRIPVRFSDWGIDTPSPPGLSVRDNGTVEFLVVAVKQQG